MMDVESMLSAIEEAEEDVRLAQRKQKELRAEIIRDIVRNEAYEFITLNISNMRRCVARTAKRR